MASKTLGQINANSNSEPLPVVRNFQSALRIVTVADTVPAAVPTIELIDMSVSRYGVHNVLVIAVESTVLGAVIQLWAKSDGVWYYLQEATTVKPNQMLTFHDIPALVICPLVTTLPAATTLHGGGTI